MTEQMDGQVSWLDQGTWFGKTCQEHSAPTKEQTSKQSSRKSSTSQSQMLPLCLCLQKSGARADASTMSWGGGLLLGEYTMHSFGEQPNMLMAECGIEEHRKDVSVSHLSQILVDSPQPKYSLSEKACIGILRRAEKRGKALPPILKEALENQISDSKELYSQN